MNYKDNLNIVKQYLPFSLRSAVEKFPSDLQEIRLRVNKPVQLYTPDKVFYLDKNLSSAEKLPQHSPLFTQKELSETFSTICSYSVYSKQNEIINGYITLKGGNRAGICGTAVTKDDSIINIKDITSINIRLCSERKGCADSVLNKLHCINDGVLFCGAPCSGKTTVLRDTARILSGKYKTALIDVRCELAAVYAGIPQNDIGFCDVLNSYTKRDGFEHALRCLSPELIICDEIAGEEDARSVLNARKSGVSVIASAHCSDVEELKVKPYLFTLIKTRCFKTIVFLSGGRSVGQVRGVYDADELL